MAIDNSTIESLAEALRQPPQATNNNYTAVVSRIDNEQTVWVNLAGSDMETPTASTSAEVKQGDVVTVEWRNNKLYIAGNTSNPSAGIIRVDAVERAAGIANQAAQSAVADARTAREAAESVEGIARHAEEVAEGVETIAESAKTAADTAFTNLSQVQSVLEVAQWIATHGTYTMATTFNPNTTYYTLTATQVADPSDEDKDSDGVLIYYELSNGVYVRTTDTEVDSQKTYYTVTGTPVTEAKAEDIAQYYTLAVTEAMANYIKSHLALTNDGLYVMADGSHWKVRIADDGVYILDPNNKPANQMTSTGNIVGYEDGARLEVTPDSLTAYNEENVKFFDMDYDGADVTETVYYPIERYINGGTLTTYWLANPTAECDDMISGLSGAVNLTNPLYEGGLYRNIFSNSELLNYGSNLRMNIDIAPSSNYVLDVVEQTNCEVILVREYTNYVKVCPTLPELIIGTTQSFTVDSYVTVRAQNIQTLESVYRRTLIRTVYNSDTDRLAQSIWRPSATGSKSSNSRYISSIVGRVEKDVQTKAPAFTYGSDSGEIKGGWSARLGYKLNASYDNQTAIGKYNDNKTDTAFEIGNGTSATERSNAFAVTWDGKVTAYPTSDTDGYIFNAEHDQSGKPCYYRVGRSDTNTYIDLGIGSGGNNHGVWSEKLRKWIVYADENNIYLDGINTNQIARKSNFASGNESVGQVAQNSYKDVTVTFENAFSAVPTVTATIVSSNTSYTMGNVSISVFNVTKTGFTARIFNARAAMSPSFNWIAIEV